MFTSMLAADVTLEFIDTRNLLIDKLPQCINNPSRACIDRNQL